MWMMWVWVMMWSESWSSSDDDSWWLDKHWGWSTSNDDGRRWRLDVDWWWGSVDRCGLGWHSIDWAWIAWRGLDVSGLDWRWLDVAALISWWWWIVAHLLLVRLEWKRIYYIFDWPVLCRLKLNEREPKGFLFASFVQKPFNGGVLGKLKMENEEANGLLKVPNEAQLLWNEFGSFLKLPSSLDFSFLEKLRPTPFDFSGKTKKQKQKWMMRVPLT